MSPRITRSIAEIAPPLLVTAFFSATGAAQDDRLDRWQLDAATAPRAATTQPATTTLPLRLRKGDRIALIGNTLFDRAQHFGHFEAALQRHFSGHELVVRHLAWSADTVTLRPRPANFADLEQHLTHEKVSVIFAAFGFNESFAGPAGVGAFEKALAGLVDRLRTKAFDGRSGPRIVLVSPIANENVDGVAAADRNNENLALYTRVMREVAKRHAVGFADVFAPTRSLMSGSSTRLTFNGVHLTRAGYAQFAKLLFRSTFSDNAPTTEPRLRGTIVDKNRQYARRYRPLNSFYYTGGRRKQYGYLDFLPAMRNFDALVRNRDARIWALAAGREVAATIDDSNVPPMPKTKASRGANRWLSAAEERKAFKLDPRFSINLFAGEEQFPDIACPIQMRWDSRGRLWVSCSTTYPHVYPGQEPNDKIVILEDTDGDGRADKSTVFADDLHIPLSFELGDHGVYVSEMPHLTFLEDTDGDDKADRRRILLTGFGTEDSHHALHDFVWTPDGDLLFRESIFHHSQIETPYGPVRQRNSGWFRFEPRKHRLTSFGTYHSTNPWGVTFDDWGQHVASHPVFASAFHALDPPYPIQHPRPKGLRAYSGTCGQEFVDFKTFPEELRGSFVKVRYKPTNRVEIHKWKETKFGYDEQYVGDLLFSTNLSFIPVDIRFGPRGALFVCDWYNPIKGHAQYSLRDERRDRHSGRIWRITAKGKKLQDPPRFADASIGELVRILERREYRYRYWSKRELRTRDRADVKKAIDSWVAALDRNGPRFRHHQVEALWAYRNIDAINTRLLKDVLACENPNARAAATRQLRYWHRRIANPIGLLQRAIEDPSPLVRLEATIAASYLGTKEALAALLEIFDRPLGGHLAYAVRTALGSHTLRAHWEHDPESPVRRLLASVQRDAALAEPTPNAKQAQFDAQRDLATIRIACVPERMKYSIERFAVTSDQPIKLVFTNADATDHNLVFVKPGAVEEVGTAANEMARHPRFARSNFVPKPKRHLILRFAPMIGPGRKSRVHVLRFRAPREPGVYPYVCTFPGHWVVMTGRMIVVREKSQIAAALAADDAAPKHVRKWKVADFATDLEARQKRSLMDGMKAYMAGRCNQCHKINGHGSTLGPDLTRIGEKYRGKDLLRQILEPSAQIHADHRTYEIQTKDDDWIVGTVIKEDQKSIHVVENQLLPDEVVILEKSDIRSKNVSKTSAMPAGLTNTLSRSQILDLLAFLEAGGYKLPPGLRHR